MPEFEAKIKASRLKHAISVLHRVNDESIFEVYDNEITSRVFNSANSMIAQVTISYGDTDDITAEAHKVGIDLNVMTSILKGVSAKEDISISEFADDTWFIERGIHQRSMRLLKPEKLRKLPSELDLCHAASIRLSGKEFKDIFSESAELGSKWVRFYATGSEGMEFQTENNDMTPETYRAKLPADRVDLRPNEPETVTSLYTIELLQAVSADIKAKDEVLVQFAKDELCEISYERDGVTIEYVIAPRIESD